MPKSHSSRKNIIDLLALGEGAHKGPAYEAAIRAKKQNKDTRIVAIDLLPLNYKPPVNLQFLQKDAIQHLEQLPTNSVRVIRDDHSFHLLPLGEKTFRKALSTLKMPKMEPNEIVRRLKNYVSLVKKALVPGGRFIVVASENTAQVVEHFLKEGGFEEVNKRKLTNKEISEKGTHETREYHRRGKEVFLIKGTKPKSKA